MFLFCLILTVCYSHSQAQNALNNCVLGNTTILAATAEEPEVESIIRQLSQHGTGGNLIIISDNDLVMTPLLQRAAATAPPRATRPVSARARAPAAAWTPGPRSDPVSGPPPASAGPAPCGDPAQVGQVIT